MPCSSMGYIKDDDPHEQPEALSIEKRLNHKRTNSFLMQIRAGNPKLLA